MADEKLNYDAGGKLKLGEEIRMRKTDLNPIAGGALPGMEELRPRVLSGLVFPPGSGPAPASLPAAPGNNPFKELPFPTPGDRIKADDFRKLSQSLRVISDAFLLSSTLFGRSFGEAKLVLASQQYEIYRVMSVFGSGIDNPNDLSLDNRKVIQIVPVELGERRVAVVLTEAVETRRFVPNLLGLTYKEASERLNAMLGDMIFPSAAMSASQLVGLSLAEAKQILSK
jgi:hypothetical protein